MRTKLALVLILLLVPLAGCVTGAARYRLVEPVASDRPVFEDKSLRITVGLKDYSKFELEVRNKTGAPLRITWGNSRIVTPSGEEKIMYKAGGRGVADRNEITTIKPGGLAVCEAYPAAHAYNDSRGREQVYPLYYKGSEEASPDALDDRPVGIILLMEVNEHARRLPIMLKVEPPVL